MIVVDTSVWIDVLRGIATEKSLYLKQRLSTADVLVGDIILLEILQGAQDDGHARNIQKRLSTFPVVAMTSPSLAVKAAKNYRRLRANGFTIRKTTDLIIGTYCIENGHTLLHADRDFAPMAAHLGLLTL